MPMRTGNRRSRICHVAAASLAALTPLAATAACDSGSHDPTVEPTVQFLSASARRTLDQGTGRFTYRLSADLRSIGVGAASGGTISSKTDDSLIDVVTGEGTFDAPRGRSSSTITFGSGFGAISAMGAGAGRPASADLNGLREDIVVDGSMVYVRAAMFAFLDTSLADKWIAIDEAALPTRAAQAGVDPRELTSAASGGLFGTGGNGLVGDPTAVLGFLDGAGAGVTERGHEQVHGADTRHLHADVSVTKALGAQPDERHRERLLQTVRDVPDGPALADHLDQLNVPVDVFIDSGGSVRRISVELDLGSLLAGVTVDEDQGPDLARLGVKVKVATDYFDLGQPVPIRVPPPGDTVDLWDAYSRFSRFGEIDGSPPATGTTPTVIHN